MDLHVEERTLLKKLDLNLVSVIVALNIIGLINLFSATHDPGSVDINRLFMMQVAWILVGWGLFFAMTIVDYKILTKIGYLIFGINVCFLVLVDIIGNIAYGAQRWLDLGFFKYQPSETMKLAVVILFAKVLSTKDPINGMGLKDLWGPLLLLLVPFGLTVAQPDLGTATMILATGGSMILFVGVKRYILVTLLVAFIIIIPIAWEFGLHDYQKNRVLTFIDPGRDPRGAGYNSIQSKIAVGSGKFLGKGFKKGTQSQLDFLPERHTDFVYSVLSEEHGFIGSFTVFTLFMIFILLGIKIANQARDRFGALLTMGCIALIFWHMFVNIGMVIGLLPIVGIPLPILSYGGSGMLTTFLALGIISSVSTRRYIF